jgi:hypothetical protein
MKGIVVDIKSRYAVALDKDGIFIRIRNTGRLKIGYEVDVQPIFHMNTGIMMKASSVAAAFLVTLGLGFGAYTYSSPYSYVDVDINPSVEITANMYDRIIHVSGLNDDGKQLMELDSLKNRKLKDGVEAILESAVKKGYLKEEDSNAVLFTVSGKNDEKVGSIEKNLHKVADDELDSAGIESDIEVEKVTMERHNEAISLGISPGKLNLIQKLIETQPGLKAESTQTLSKMSVKDIMKSIKQVRKEDKQENKDTEKQNRDLGKDNNTNTGNINEGVMPSDAVQGKNPKDKPSKTWINKDDKSKELIITGMFNRKTSTDSHKTGTGNSAKEGTAGNSGKSQGGKPDNGNIGNGNKNDGTEADMGESFADKKGNLSPDKNKK